MNFALIKTPKNSAGSTNKWNPDHSEVWYNLTKAETKELEEVDEILILETVKSHPKEGNAAWILCQFSKLVVAPVLVTYSSISGKCCIENVSNGKTDCSFFYSKL